MSNIIHGSIALAVLLAIAWACGEDRRRVPVRVVVAGVGLQLALAVLFTKVPPLASSILVLADGVGAVQKATDAGMSFAFGYLGGAPLPFAETHPGASYILALRALPVILTIGALSALLFHWGVLQRIVRGVAFVLRSTVGIGGALGIGAAVHIFVGMVEAPLLIKPYLRQMSRGELFALMSCGMAGIAGSVMVIYATLIGPIVPDALPNILIASFISTPAALAVAALMVPFAPDPSESANVVIDDPPATSMEAITRGTGDGLRILANVAAMLVVLVALVALVNMALALLPAWEGAPLTLQRLAGLAFRPFIWLIGVPAAEVPRAAELMGTKTMLNEFIAYVDMSHLPTNALGPRARLIMTYTLCGFANLGSLGIMIGGMAVMAPERRRDIVALGPRALLSGTLATLMSGAVAGMLAA